MYDVTSFLIVLKKIDVLLFTLILFSLFVFGSLDIL